MSEKVTIKVERKKLHLPTIALRGLVVFPNNLVHFEVGREKSIAAVEWAMANNSNVFLVAQKSMDTTEPQQADLFSYGVVAEVKQVLRVSGDLVKVLVEGKYRAKLSALDASGDFLLSEVRPAPVRAGKADDAVETEALLRALKAGFDEYLGMNPRLGKDVVFAGGLYACYLGVLDPSTFGFMKSIEILVMVVLGGMGSMLGSILSATVLTILPEATRSFDSYRMVVYSLVLVLMMIFRPGGLLGSYDFSMSRIVEKIMNGELFQKKAKEGKDHE